MLTNRLITSIHDKHTYSAEDDLNNVPNYADISLSGLLPPPPAPPLLLSFPLSMSASALVSCPSTQLLCVIAIRRDGRGGSQIRA